LLDPGDSPAANAQFLTVLSAVIKAVDENQDLLRVSVASAGNDHRLGANEAPPAIISIFLGDELTGILEAIETDVPYDSKEASRIEVGVSVLPSFKKDTTDRNRTSPFAFTGNKFEFRMVGSTASIAFPNTVLNTIVAQSLKEFADELEGAADFTSALNALIKRTINAHKRILFNGNNYSDDWVVEAEKRGLLNLRSTAEALPYYISPKNIELLTSHGILSEIEIHSRYEILLEEYVKTVHIEALTMIDIAKKQIIPAAITYTKQLTETALQKKSLDGIDFSTETALLKKLSALTAQAYQATEALGAALDETKLPESAHEQTVYYRSIVVPAMEALRAAADEIEANTSKAIWPYPTYSTILFSV
jgi:glutamine synthetase